MKIRQTVVVTILILLGMAGAGAVVALYSDVSVKASSTSLPEALSNIPSDYQIVFGMNVQKFVQSPAYAKMQQNRKIWSELSGFIEQTGLDPARDIYYLVGAGRAKEKTKDQGIAIATGQFNRDAIVRYIRSRPGSVEKEYNGKTVFMIADPATQTVQKGLAFLNAREIALGDLESLKAVLDIGGDEKKSIVSNADVWPLINSVNSDEMFWFVGDAAGALANAPAATALGANVSFIKNVVGTLTFGDAVTGKITATALNVESALKLADAIRGFIALGQLTGAKNPQLKTLLGGLAVSQNSTQVSVALDVSTDLLEKIGQGRNIGRPPIQ